MEHVRQHVVAYRPGLELGPDRLAPRTIHGRPRSAAQRRRVAEAAGARGECAADGPAQPGGPESVPALEPSPPALVRSHQGRTTAHNNTKRANRRNTQTGTATPAPA
jgi:hypothetical protein